MHTFEQRETIEVDPKSRCIDMLTKSVNQWESIIDGLAKYFSSEVYKKDYKNIINSHSPFTVADWWQWIYTTVTSSPMLTDVLLENSIVISLMQENEELFCNINDTHKIFFLINTPTLFNQVITRSGHILTYSIDNQKTKDTVLQIKSIDWRHEVSYMLDQYPLLQKYYWSCEWWDCENITLPVLSRTQRSARERAFASPMGNIDDFWNISIDPIEFTETWSYLTYNKSLWGKISDPIDITLDDWSIIVVDKLTYDIVCLHEWVHSLDQKYYNLNKLLHITIDGHTIETVKSQENFKAISEIKAILIETYYSDELIGSRLYPLLIWLSDHTLDINFDRTQLKAHDQWSYLIFKKVTSLLSKGNKSWECNGFRELIAVFEWNTTVEEVIHPLWLASKDFIDSPWRIKKQTSWDDRVDFSNNNWSTYKEFIDDLRIHVFHDPETRKELNAYIESILDDIYFWN